MKTLDIHANSNWPWWKMAGTTLLGFGVFGAIIAIMPSKNIPSTILGVASIICAIPLGIWNWKHYSWASRISFASLWILQLLTIGIIAWVHVLPSYWIYPLISLFIIAWALPALTTRISDVLWREQNIPQTKIGKTLLGIAISLAPVAGALGATFGIFSSRFNGISSTYIVAGPLFIFLAIAMAFAISYQLWPERPWSKKSR